MPDSGLRVGFARGLFETYGRVSGHPFGHYGNFGGLVSPQLPAWASFSSRAAGRFQPRAECRRRGFRKPSICSKGAIPVCRRVARDLPRITFHAGGADPVTACTAAKEMHTGQRQTRHLPYGCRPDLDCGPSAVTRPDADRAWAGSLWRMRRYIRACIRAAIVPRGVTAGLKRDRRRSGPPLGRPADVRKRVQR